SVLQQFYSSRQTDKETVTSWGLRLEGILQKAIRKGQIHPEQRNEMLRIKFWRGLQSDELRNATRMAFETERDFEVLRKKVRSEECEIETNRKDSEAMRPGKENQETIQQQQIQLNKDKSMFADIFQKSIVYHHTTHYFFNFKSSKPLKQTMPKMFTNSVFCSCAL
ncbi:MAG: hypothetical protein ABW185_29890, partial [Sedimenticola sp.]